MLTPPPGGEDEPLVVELWLLPAVSQPRSRDCCPGNQEPVCAVLRAPSGMLAVLLQEGFPSSSLPRALGLCREGKHRVLQWC